jgi:hypothetical protein
MEIAKFKRAVADCFLEKAKPFTTKRDLNRSAIGWTAGVTVGIAIVVLLLLPSPKAERGDFHEQVRGAGAGSIARSGESDTSRDALSQLAQSQAAVRMPPASLDALYGGASGGGAGPKRDTAMILSREGGDARSQLPAGLRVAVRLREALRVSSQSMPIIGQVARDCLYEGSAVIPQGAKVYGEASLDEESDRVSVKWQTIEFSDGRRRVFTAMGVSPDGQPGIEGAVHSEAWKNTVGHTVTRFIGAYAEGATEHGALGSSPGGAENGLKSAIAATAKDRAEAWAEGLQKERKWAEIEAAVEVWAVLTQPFVFRDPGALGGR